MYKRLGIFGGSFDPIHIGHLVMAEMVRQECGLDEVVFIPAGNPPHKTKRKLAPSWERYNMVQMATADNPYFRVSSMEIEREGRSFTIDTLMLIREAYPSDWEFWFIIGGDTLLEIRTWRNASEVLKMCKFAVYHRPGYALDQCRKEAELLHREMGANIIFIPGPLIEISSTEVRERFLMGKSIRYLVPRSVEDYMREHVLYGNAAKGRVEINISEKLR